MRDAPRCAEGSQAQPADEEDLNTLDDEELARRKREMDKGVLAQLVGPVVG